MLDHWDNLDDEQHFAEYCAVVAERDRLRALCREAAELVPQLAGFVDEPCTGSFYDRAVDLTVRLKLAGKED